MPSSKIPVKIRLEQELAQKLHQLHPGYGEATRVVTELVTAYLGNRQTQLLLTEEMAIQRAVKGRTA
jgi:hypothetical protein